MMGTMAEEMEGVINMAEVGMRELQKHRRQRHGRNWGPWEINFREDHRDDGYGVGYAGQWRWQFWGNHNGVDASWQGCYR